MIDPTTAPYGVLILRLCFGIMFIAHATDAIFVYTMPSTVAQFKSVGLPGWAAQVTMAVELAGGAAFILGIWPRIVALLLAPLIVGTIVTVHGKNGWLFSNRDGGWEYPAFWAAALLVQFLVGDGPWALVASPPIRW